MSQADKQRVQQQFGNKAADYAESAVHAQGSSLTRLIELTEPQADWVVLDVATGAGHTAHIFAPRVERVIASDLTPQMLPKARELAQIRGLVNLTVSAADAESLPYVRDTFDLLTCRLGAHHFPDVTAFVHEAARVLKQGGLLAVTDNVAPGSTRSDRKARLLQAAGRYMNAFEKLRDPSHQRFLSLFEWRQQFYSAGFALLHEENTKKAIDFVDYVARSGVIGDDVVRLRAMLVQAPEQVLEFLTPVFRGDRITFYLSEVIFIGRLE